MSGGIERVTDEASGEVVRRLESGEGPADVARGLGLGAVDLVGAIARAGLGGEGSEGPTLEQARPARPRMERAVTAIALADLFPDVSKPARLALSAGLFQILDFWDAGHTAAQEADDLGERTTAAYWHLIAHRREPDPGNALYWARRVGRHPIHEPLARAARTLLEDRGDSKLADLLTPANVWSPATMIDLATRTRPGSFGESLVRRLQRLEMIHLLQASLSAIG